MVKFNKRAEGSEAIMGYNVKYILIFLTFLILSYLIAKAIGIIG